MFVDGCCNVWKSNTKMIYWTFLRCWLMPVGFAVIEGSCIDWLMNITTCKCNHVVFSVLFSWDNYYSFCTHSNCLSSRSCKQPFRQPSKCVDQCLPQLSICPEVCQTLLSWIFFPLELYIYFVTSEGLLIMIVFLLNS